MINPGGIRVGLSDSALWSMSSSWVSHIKSETESENPFGGVPSKIHKELNSWYKIRRTENNVKEPDPLRALLADGDNYHNNSTWEYPQFTGDDPERGLDGWNI